MAIAVVNNHVNFIAPGSLCTTSAAVGEEAAVDLAMVASTRIRAVIRASKSAILHFSREQISQKASAILISAFDPELRTNKMELI